MADEIDVYLATALRLAGFDPTADDLAMVRLVHDAMGRRVATLTADLLAIPIEYDLDPSRAPRS
jgi:hypothetical protein